MEPRRFPFRDVLCVSIVAAICIGYGGWLRARQIAMQSWPVATAVVTEYSEGIDKEWSGQWYANPKATYRYEVSGREFTGSRLNPSIFNYQSQSRFLSETSHLKQGALTKCVYNPADPSEAYLLNLGVTHAPNVFIAIGIGLIVLPILVLSVQAFRKSPLPKMLKSPDAT